MLDTIGRTLSEAQALLQKLTGLMAPEARTVVETDWSVPHALERVVSREHPDLLVLGSNRHGPTGRVLRNDAEREASAMMVAPRPRLS